ncbi:leukotriene C4 synthase-like [Acipenser oxyrinchus oxyrinchus]|uniref:Leukotriene C4 synthase-like n=1 Tax=Acipenser oxyrinchus oxyrinchus TaxID=40147 RepID=A0AAD8CZU2_ACIOX|nr:leukotriene C4 synthase-like [Acipenser oxyrinchus oxyrinchus]
MLDQMVYVAAVTVLGVLEQAYFSLQVIYARRKYSVPPPSIAGPPEFERVYRAQVNCAEYFPLFVSMLWVASLYFSKVVAPLCGLLYLYGRYQYFHGYAQSSQGRLAPMYFSARVLWLLIGFSTVGVLSDLSKIFFGVAFLQGLKVFLRSYWIPF